MDTFIDLCKQRQSCRSYANRKVEHEKLLNCIEAARLTPSACNSQPWEFVVVETPELVSQVAKCTQVLGANSYTDNATAFVVVLEKHATLMPGLRTFLDSQYFAKGDLGAATVTMCYAAQEQGVGTCILGLYNREKLCEVLNLPVDTKFFCVVSFGYPADDTTRTKSRKQLNEIAKFL